MRWKIYSTLEKKGKAGFWPTYSQSIFVSFKRYSWGKITKIIFLKIPRFLFFIRHKYKLYQCLDGNFFGVV